MYKLSELESWKSARQLRISVSELARLFPNDEKYRLKDQILRSSRSIPANIAEGYGRYHYQENIQFCRIACGSLYETLEHLMCAKDEGYITAEQFQDLNDQILECLKILNGYVQYLKKAKKST